MDSAAFFKPKYYGDDPVYDEYHYNNEENLGFVLKQCHSQSRVCFCTDIFSESQRIAEQFVHRCAKLICAIRETEVKVVWISVQHNTSEIFLLARLHAELAKIWLDSSHVEKDSLVSKLLTLRDSNSLGTYSYFKERISPLLSQLHNQFIVFYFSSSDRQSTHSFSSHLIEYLLGTPSTNDILILNSYFKGKERPSIKLKSPNKVDVQNHPLLRDASSQKSEKKYFIDSLSSKELLSLKPLAMLSHPANPIIIDFISQYYEGLPESLKGLNRVDLIHYLSNSSISLTSELSAPLDQINLKTNKGLIYSSIGASALSIDSQTELSRIYKTSPEVKFEADTKLAIVSHLSTALAAASCANSKTLQWQINALREHISEQDLISIKNQEQVELILRYAGQLLLVTKISDKHYILKIMEELSERYANFLLHLNNQDSKVRMKASRVMYRVGHIYDRVKNPDRKLYENKFREKIYSMSAEILSPEYDSQCTMQYAEIIYRRGTALVHAGEPEKAAQLYKKYAVKFHDIYCNETKNNVFNTQSVLASDEFTFYAISCLKLPKLDPLLKKMLRSIIERSGADITAELLFNLVNIDRPYSLNIPDISKTRKPECLINVVGSDLHTALLVAEDLFRNKSVVSKIKIWNAGVPKRLNDSRDFELVINIGAPDTPGGLGNLIATEFPLLDETYHLRMEETFSEPVLTTNKDGVIVLVLCGSGLNSIMNGWSQICVDVFGRLSCKKRFMLEELILKSFLGSVFSKISGKLIDVVAEKASSRILENTDIEKTDISGEKSIGQGIKALIESTKEDKITLDQLETSLSLNELKPIIRTRVLKIFEHQSVGQIMNDSLEYVLSINANSRDVLSCADIFVTVSRSIASNVGYSAESRRLFSDYANSISTQSIRLNELIRSEKFSTKEENHNTFSEIQSELSYVGANLLKDFENIS